MPDMLKRFASNAGANIFSGAAAAGYQLAITLIGSRTWEATEFASWALALSVAAISPVFAANLSSVVTRRIVEARHSQWAASESAIVISGRRIGHHLTAAAFTILACAGMAIQARSGAATMSSGAFSVLLLLLLVANSWLLLWQVRFGRHYADERNWLPALTLASARLGGVLGLIAGLSAGDRSLASAAFGLCAGTWTGLGCARVLLPNPRFAKPDEPQPATLDIQKQYRISMVMLSGFAVGAVSMLVIQYSIPPLMALIAPERFNAFYLASTLNSVAVGMLAAAMSAMLAPLTRWHSNSDTRALRRAALFSPILCAGSCLIVLCFAWVSMEAALRAVSVRAAEISEIRSFLALLGFQTIIRNAASGYAMFIASAGSSRQIAAPLIIEIFIAFVVAVPLGWIYGEYSLIYGLMLASLIGSQYSSKFVGSQQAVRPALAFSALLLSQAAGCGFWWLIVRGSL